MKKRVTSEIKTVDRIARETQRKIEDEAVKIESQETAHHKSSKKQQEEELESIRKSLQETVSSNRDIEQSLRKVTHS